MSRTRLVGLIALFLCASLLGASGGSWIPSPPSREQDQAINTLLEGLATTQDITKWAGVDPHACLAPAPGYDLCEWRLSKRERAWRGVARLIGTSKRIALICVLPKDGGPRLPLSCVARPRRTNRVDFSTKRFVYAYNYEVPEVRAVMQKVAQEWIDAASTLTSLSFLLGALPDACEGRDEGRRACTWHLYNGTHGHGTVATALGVQVRKKVTLRCELPTDGRPRAVDTCEAAIDEG